jgi:hypothetical protein
MPSITEFRVIKLFGTRNITLSIKDNTIIIVGPNGVGKKLCPEHILFVHFAPMVEANHVQLFLAFAYDRRPCDCC